MSLITKIKLFYKDKNVLIQNFLSLTMLQIVNYILPLATVPYLTRVLGPEKYGLIGFSTAFINYFIILTDYGFNLSATREISIHKNDKQKISSIFSSVMIIKIIFAILSFIITCFVVFSFSRFKINYAVYLISFGLVIGNILFPTWFFQGMEDMKYIANFNLVAKVLSTASIFIFINDQSKFMLLIIINSTIPILIGIVSLVIIFRKMKIKFILPNIKEIRLQLIEGWYIFISSISIVMYTSSTTFILGLFTNDKIVGYYVGADKIRMAVQGLLGPVFQTLYPYVNKLAKESKEKVLKIIRYETIFISAISIVFCVLTIIFAKPIVVFILGKGYLESIPILRVLALNPLLVALGNILTIQCLLSFELKKEYSRIYLTTSVIGLGLIVLLTYLYSSLGTAFSILIIETLVVALTVKTLRKNKIHIFKG